MYRRAQYALELPAGAIEVTGTAVGDRLSWGPASVPVRHKTVQLGRAARMRAVEGVES
jgi:hypothetical protein